MDTNDDDKLKAFSADVRDALEGQAPEVLLAAVVRRLRDTEESLDVLRKLVTDAFIEGFRSRQPDQEEPWLADWIVSESKQRLEAIFPRRAQVSESD